MLVAVLVLLLVAVAVLVAVKVRVGVRVFEGVREFVGVFEAVTVYSKLDKVNELCTSGAEAQSTPALSTPPGWAAVRVQVPLPTKLTVYLLVIVQTEGVVELYCTGKVEVAVAK